MAGTIDSLELIGGDVALDLVNTASARREGPLTEHLGAYADVIRWAERVELIGARSAKRLRAEAQRRPGEAESALERIRALREVLYRIFEAGLRGESAPESDIEVFSGAVAEAAARRTIEAGEDGYRYAFPESTDLDQFAWPVALSAAELLVSEDRLRVKECATDNCNWLFVDMSRNRSRRWCDMKDCGNRAKARRHYARSREG